MCMSFSSRDFFQIYFVHYSISIEISQLVIVADFKIEKVVLCSMYDI